MGLAMRRFYRTAILTTFIVTTGSSAFAEESIFGFVYTTDLLPQGGKEIEQWLTWRHQKIAGTYDQLEGRTEFEYGLASNLQAAVYLNYAWTQAYHNGPFGATTPPEQFSDLVVGPDDFFNAKRFVGVSGELIYRILSPYTDGIGLALYTEPTIGRNFFELENKVILQKNFMDDLLTVAFNFTYAPEFLENGRWLHMADLSKRYQGVWSVQFVHPLIVRCAIEYRPKAGQSGPAFRDEFIITPDGVLSTVKPESPGSTQWGVTWPILENDGAPLERSGGAGLS